ncbi:MULTISPECIES: hypothetical protein [Lactobacillaceae]|uniref:Uncharacterized protein n=1 Tax=Ligilactobacillus murinus TaxID=1622 RepID=A0AAD0KXC0_9LACO|nr:MULTISPECIES: hypothetical protein [Lactobacillaceae]MDE7022987.1 hypothetical protein [Ligilactobacillus sp.]AWZ37996.1 hypothetical protein CPS94_03185 [Ligilactobacillus murinus]AWZ41011.1 hypothetical protein CPQ89_08265 [Ligilactobacillus murinus]MCR1891747.1 hypothetical protein [Ligilactobacillus murinus]MCR1897175.1 hypothetical protein [Ligilactobacillus murinus]
MQMIYDNFYEFAEEHQELAEFFLDKERGYFSYFDEGEEVPNDWDKRAIYYYEDLQEYEEYRRNDCTCIDHQTFFELDQFNGEVIEISKY